MNIYREFIRSSFLTVVLSSLPFLVSAVDVTPPKGDQSSPSGKLSNALIVVEKIMGTDEEGNSQTLYHDEEGLIYRLDNIDQVVLNIDAHKTKLIGTFRSLHAVLGNTIYLKGVSVDPQPTLRIATEIPERLPLAVDALKITENHVIAIYPTNCMKTVALPAKQSQC